MGLRSSLMTTSSNRIMRAAGSAAANAAKRAVAKAVERKTEALARKVGGPTLPPAIAAISQ